MSSFASVGVGRDINAAINMAPAMIRLNGDGVRCCMRGVLFCGAPIICRGGINSTAKARRREGRREEEKEKQTGRDRKKDESHAEPRRTRRELFRLELSSL